ncbi:Ubiquitin carboxyl-terminal hydrolase 45 [Anthophora plagiata]
MSKKRNRQPSVNEELSEGSTDFCDVCNCSANTIANICSHISKAVNFNKVKKHIKKVGISTECPVCKKCKDNDKEHVIQLATLICLLCGHQGCGKVDDGHALVHYKKAHSDPHFLVVDNDEWNVWCFSCQTKVNIRSGKKLYQTVEFIKRCTIDKNSLQTEMTQTQSDEEVIDIDKNETEKVVYNFPKVGGLINLGNTCFFNAVLQCLAQTPFLVKVLDDLRLPGQKFILLGGKHKLANSSEEVDLPPIEGTLENWGSFTSILWKTLTEMQNSDGHQSYRPSELLNEFKKKTMQCMDGGQHDSHELLRHLLEIVRNEDLKRYQSIILKEFGLNEKTNPEGVEESLKSRVKFYGNQSNARLLGTELVFRGVLVSTLKCLDCHHSSQSTEPFLDLSLPVMADKPQPPALKRKNNGFEDIFDVMGNNMSYTPSKYQLKKEKKAARKNRKNKKQEILNHGHSLVFSKNDVGDVLESEESDADVEDNVEVEGILPATDSSVTSKESPTSPSPTLTNDKVLEDIQFLSMLESINHDKHEWNQRKIRRKKEVCLNEISNGIDNITSGISKIGIDGSLQQSPTRYPMKEGECSILSCLNQFTALELMSGSNKVSCEACTAKEKKVRENYKMICTPSTKQYLISRVPAVLILHLKRMQAQRVDFRKVTRHVSFPILLDLAPICKNHKKPRIYALYGVVEHSGTIHGGHYVAYVKSRLPLTSDDPRWSFLPSKDVKDDTQESPYSSSSDSDGEETVEPPPGKWYHISDSRVMEVDETTVLQSQAYLLFYERIV